MESGQRHDAVPVAYTESLIGTVVACLDKPFHVTVLRKIIDNEWVTGGRWVGLFVDIASRNDNNEHSKSSILQLSTCKHDNNNNSKH